MLKFWAALILGTIGISAGLTYLKLYRGAQTQAPPPPAVQTQQAHAEFIADTTPGNMTRMETSGSNITFHVKESIIDQE
jgi:hypothetical protein